jgi:uncharacterized protein
VLVYAFREDSPEHVSYRAWLNEVVRADALYAVTDLVLSGFLRVVTHPRVFSPPTPLRAAVDFVDGLREQPNCVVLAPGPRH